MALRPYMRDPAYPGTSTCRHILQSVMKLCFRCDFVLPAGLGGSGLARGEGTGSAEAEQKGENSSERRHREITNV